VSEQTAGDPMSEKLGRVGNIFSLPTISMPPQWWAKQKDVLSTLQNTPVDVVGF
jgi:hypothetical protein